jgi:lipoprotein NlpD
MGDMVDMRRADRATPLIVLVILAGCIPQGGRLDENYSQYPSSPPAHERQRADNGVQSLPAPPPAWQARPVAANARTIEASSYVVRPGDTVRSIADRTGAGSEAIARTNHLVAPFIIQPGQRLEIPAGRYHLVRAGETGIAIARAYGVNWSRIVTANDLSEPYSLRVGMRVLIPGVPGASSAAERAAAFRLDVDDIVTGGEPALAINQRPARPTSSPSRVLPSTAAIVAPEQLRGGFVWPVHGRVVARFGPGATGEKYNGIKIAVPLDTPIRAAADGVVAYTGSEVPTLGGLVILKHGGGWATVYGHASQLLVQRGQSVKRGQTIAMSGDSGFADRPEVHFEIRKGRTPVDPIAELPRQ